MKTYSSKPGNETSKIITCPTCGEAEFAPHWDCGDFSFVKCGNCGLLYQNPQPKLDELIKRYDGDYFSYEIDNEKNFFGLMKLGLEDINFFNLLGEGEERSFLDIGCATGMLISHLQDQGWRTAGVEVCAPSAEYGIKERGVDIRICTLEQAEFPDNSFQVVHCSHLIEHLTDPASFVNEVKRILKPGGYFIVTTPNTAGFQTWLFKEKWRSAIADHMCLFSVKNLRYLLSRYGFKDLKWKTWGGLAVGSAPRGIKAIVDKMAKKFGFGDVMLCLARKELQ